MRIDRVPESRVEEPGLGARALDPAAQVRMRPQRQAIGLVGAAGTGEQRDIGNGVRVAGNEVAPRELCI